MQQAGEHFERGGLACAVGTQEPDYLAGFEVERDAVHRRHLYGAALDQPLQGGPSPAVLLADGEYLAQVLDVNGRGGLHHHTR